MAITSDFALKGHDWRIALDKMRVFYPTMNAQLHYKVFIISASLGIMFDSQLDIAGEELDEDKESKLSVPRTVLNAHESEIAFLCQTAIMTSKLINFTTEKRIEYAFNPNSQEFNRTEFLIKFANYGVGKLLEKISDDPIETMENLKTYMNSIKGGFNYDVEGISDEDLSIEDLIE